MKKRLIVFRALPKYRDARTVRYLLTEGYDEVLLNTWEDENNDKGLFNCLKIDRNKVSKKITYPLYLVYLLLHSLFAIRWNDDVICMDLDTFIPVYLGSFFKKGKVYLDIVDPIAETKFQSLSFNNIFDYIEMFFLKYRKYNILPNENRIDYYKVKYNIDVTKFKYNVIENVPLLSISSDKKCTHTIQSRTTIGYFGTIEATRGIVELIDYIKKTDINLIIAGDGQLKEVIINKIEKLSNIQYLGPFKYEEIEKLYERIDFLWAYYSPNVFLHQFASPNKYYEHLAFATPIIVNRCIPQSHSIIKNNSGIVINNILNDDTFRELLNKIEQYNYKLSNFFLWKEKYSEYKIILEDEKI